MANIKGTFINIANKVVYSRCKFTAMLVIIFLCAMVLLLGLWHTLTYDIDAVCKNDFIRNNAAFTDIVGRYNGNDFTIIRKNAYGKSDSSLFTIFGYLGYEFISVKNGNVFFCKGYSGINGVGIMYVCNYINPENENIRVPLDETQKWYICEQYAL